MYIILNRGFKSLSRIYFNDILLGILLILSLIIRIANFDTQSFHLNSDGNRSYLVANHILKYGEFPLTGGLNSYLPDLRSNPTPYYLYAGLLLIKNDVLFLGWVNIFFNILTIMAIYILTRVMFSKGTALISATLFSFSQIGFNQAIFYIWEPFLVQPLLILSLLLFIFSYRKKSYLLLLIGIFIYSFSCTLYYSAFFILPVILLIIFYILKQQNRGSLHFIGAFGVLLGLLLIFYFPLLFYHIINTTNLLSLKPRKSLIMPIDFLPELSSLLYIFSDSYFMNLDKNLLSLNNFLFLIVMGSLVNSCFSLKQATKKLYYFLILTMILTPLSIITLLQLNRPFHDPQSITLYGLVRYFLISIVLFIILIADVINSTFSKNSFLKLIKMLIILTLIHISFPTLPTHLNNLFGQLSRNLQMNSQNFPAVEVIKEEIYRLKDKEGFDNPNFFRINFYVRIESTNSSYTTENPASAFWVILEKELNSRLVKVSDKSLFNYEQIGDDKIIFLVCHQYLNSIDEQIQCVDDFKGKNTNHSVVRRIYSQFPYSIYLTKKLYNL